MTKRLLELGEFLRTRRERLNPLDFGFEIGRRRTPGLRREEVAHLANISTTLYTKLEQGRDINVSKAVLDSLSDALELTFDEKEHLYVLADKTLNRPHVEAQSTELDPSYQLILDNIKKYPAYILDNRYNIVAWNDVARTIFGDYNTFEKENLNVLWRVFTDKEFKKRLGNWEEIAYKLLTMFRSGSVYFIDQEWYDDFVKRLKEESKAFKTWWSKHDVKIPTTDLKVIIHPELGTFNFKHNTFSLNEYQNYILTIYVPNNCEETEAILTNLAKK